ncbi:hypothetical protein ACTIVE_5380 [Actinomadura verrucosospora]|uniref:Uncharacterized protein n=1 Tax=Actinomadura verrucosospora TaxID=46165 RepID=A0A7D3ZHG9_ACTVE|nr:hypothetical protein ACTIVE_5380 [Actinomadura verrucosospora]
MLLGYGERRTGGFVDDGVQGEVGRKRLRLWAARSDRGAEAWTRCGTSSAAQAPETLRRRTARARCPLLRTRHRQSRRRRTEGQDGDSGRWANPGRKRCRKNHVELAMDARRAAGGARFRHAPPPPHGANAASGLGLPKHGARSTAGGPQRVLLAWQESEAETTASGNQWRLGGSDQAPEEPPYSRFAEWLQQRSASTEPGQWPTRRGSERPAQR